MKAFSSKHIPLLIYSLIVTLTLVSVIATLSLLRIESRLSNVLSLTNQQVEIWSKLNHIIRYQPKALLGGQSNLKLTSQLRQEIQTYLEKSHQIEQEIEELILRRSSLLLFFSREKQQQLAMLSNVEPRFLEHVEALAQYPDELLEIGYTTWDSDMQIATHTQSYLAPLQTLSEKTLAISDAYLKRATLILLLINLAEIIIGISIWHFFIKRMARKIEATESGLSNTQHQLFRREAQLQAAFFSIEDAVCLLNSQGQITEHNAAFNGFLEHQPNTDKLYFYDIFKSANTQYDDIAQTKDSAIIIRKWDNSIFERADRFYLLKISRVGDEDWLLMAIDQTKLIQESEEKHQAENLKQIGTIAGGVAHDFNNILATMMAHIELFQMGTKSEEDVNETLDVLEKSCERASRRISQLLLYARKQPLNPELVSVEKIASELQGQLLSPEHIRLVIKNQASGMVFLDLSIFITACENILKNSIDAIGDQPGVIHFHLGDRPCESQLSVERLEVVIQDSGSGFYPEVLEKATTPFFTTKQANMGTGLGLPMVASFMDQCDGELHLNNVSDGAKITLLFRKYLPLISDQIADDTLRAPDNASYCLVLEDNEALNQIIQKTIEAKGIQCLSAPDLASGFDLVSHRSLSIDYVVCDWQLPDGTSNTFISHLLRRYPNLPILLITGFDDGVASSFADKAGIHFLLKPFKMNKISEILKIKKVSH